MKSDGERLAELEDMVIKLVWTCTVFSEYWKKGEGYRVARMIHPEFSLVLHNSLLCYFFVSTRILFNEGGNNESLPNFIAHLEQTHRKPALTKHLRSKLKASKSTLEKLRDLRDDVFAHRFQDKKAEDVMSAIQPKFSQMKQVANLAKEILYELLDKDHRAFLEGQQLSQSTLQSIAADTTKVLDAFAAEIGD